MRRLAALVVMGLSVGAQARPYRAMITRTAETTAGGNVEVGLRYQGFVFGEGQPGGLVSASPWHQVAAHARWGIIDGLELDAQVEALIELTPGSLATVHFGDIPVGLQWRFLNKPKVALGVFVRLTFPTGPGNIDELPPTLSDGTWDAEASFLAEVRPAPWFRLMANVGFLYNGWRNRSPNASFDVPEAIKWGVAATFNVGKRWLFALEVVGHDFFRADITPVWVNNQHLIEVIPGVRFEIIARLVLEAGLGISVTNDLRQIWGFRPLVGLTYEFGNN